MKQLISILVIALFVAQCSGSVPSRKRREADMGTDSGVVAIINSILDLVEAVPVAGSIFKAVRTKIVDVFQALQNITNGGFARVLGGALPCRIDEKDGLRCSGLTRGHNITSLIIDVANQGPLPKFLTNILKSLLERTLDPVFDLLFGGVPTQ